MKVKVLLSMFLFSLAISGCERIVAEPEVKNVETESEPAHKYQFNVRCYSNQDSKFIDEKVLDAYASNGGTTYYKKHEEDEKPVVITNALCVIEPIQE